MLLDVPQDHRVVGPTRLPRHLHRQAQKLLFPNYTY